MNAPLTPVRCRATAWMHNRLCVCERRLGHDGEHMAYPAPDVSWAWTDRELPTIYPKDKP